MSLYTVTQGNTEVILDPSKAVFIESTPNESWDGVPDSWNVKVIFFGGTKLSLKNLDEEQHLTIIELFKSKEQGGLEDMKNEAKKGVGFSAGH